MKMKFDTLLLCHTSIISLALCYLPWSIRICYLLLPGMSVVITATNYFIRVLLSAITNRKKEVDIKRNFVVIYLDAYKFLCICIIDVFCSV